jgi:trehalose-6-phosphatase
MTNKKQWIKLFEIQSKQWMHRIRSIMEEYCENIEGTLVEERSCTVIWNYKNAEEEYGSKSANILAEQI